MKKIFLTAVALITMATQVFGMYGVDSDWIDFLTHGNQFRARLNQLGFTLGNDTIRGTFGFNNKAGKLYGNIVSENDEARPDGMTTHPPKMYYNFDPTISMGLAYTSPLISVGVGYNATIGTTKWQKYNGKDNYKNKEAVVHTPVLVLNALDNAFRMAFPIQILHLSDKYTANSSAFSGNTAGKGSVTAISFDAQFRYYTGLEVLPQIRLYLKYGKASYNFQPDGADKIKGTAAESFGFDFRLYFGSVVEEVSLQPIVKIKYNMAIGRQHANKAVTAVGVMNDSVNIMNKLNNTSNPVYVDQNGEVIYKNARWGTGAWDLAITPALGLNASSDIVTLYLEPSLGFVIEQDGDPTEKNVKERFKLGYGVYAEIYVRPIQSVEWYFEAELGNIAENSKAPSPSGTINAGIGKGLGFNASTGITWYLPQL